MSPTTHVNVDPSARRTIDLRSDTVTLPTPAMRKAMLTAELGDDVLGEDPTVNRLEELAARKLGKEAALLVPSGTMANLASVLTRCSRGEEIILGDRSHIFLNEAGGISALGGIHPHTLPNLPNGTLALDRITGAVRGDNVHFPRTGLICLENTHNRCCGSALPLEYHREVRDLADDMGRGAGPHRGEGSGLVVHLDGARIFNAAAALDVDAGRIAATADSVSFCLSKGLCAPVGSLICGTEEFISEARRTRKMLGGGMRQAGVIAAAGIAALEEMVDRLREDHEHAARLRTGLEGIPGISLYEGAGVLTNIT
jgi:threonine aldolase